MTFLVPQKSIRSRKIKKWTPPDRRTSKTVKHRNSNELWSNAIIPSRSFKLVRCSAHSCTRIQPEQGRIPRTLCMRYLMQLKILPSHCPCGAKFDLNSCNELYVETEPPVANPQQNQVLCLRQHRQQRTTRHQGMRILACGQNAFFDVRVTNANNASQINTNLDAVLRMHEIEKKRKYNKRVMEL